MAADQYPQAVSNRSYEREGADALPESTALARTRSTGAFAPTRQAFWAVARRTDGDAAATQELIDVLLLQHTMEAGDVIAGVGYVELDRRGAELVFEVLTEREEKNSVAIASNKSLSG